MDIDTGYGFRQWLLYEGREDLAEELSPEWCWHEIVQWAKCRDLLGTELHEKFIQKLVAGGCGMDLYRHQYFCGHNDDVFCALLKSESPCALYYHQLNCGQRDDVLQALLATSNEFWLLRYQENFGYRDDVTAALEALELKA